MYLNKLLYLPWQSEEVGEKFILIETVLFIDDLIQVPFRPHAPFEGSKVIKGYEGERKKAKHYIPWYIPWHETETKGSCQLAE